MKGRVTTRHPTPYLNVPFSNGPRLAECNSLPFATAATNIMLLQHDYSIHGYTHGRFALGALWRSNEVSYACPDWMQDWIMGEVTHAFVGIGVACHQCEEFDVHYSMLPFVSTLGGRGGRSKQWQWRGGQLDTLPSGPLSASVLAQTACAAIEISANSDVMSYIAIPIERERHRLSAGGTNIQNTTLSGAHQRVKHNLLINDAISSGLNIHR